jgi:hypothetical protein
LRGVTFSAAERQRLKRQPTNEHGHGLVSPSGPSFPEAPVDAGRSCAASGPRNAGFRG